MSMPTRTVLWQYGYRINETGVEWWGFFDGRYNGANSTTREQAEKYATEAVEAAAAVGVKVTYTLLRRGRLTTVWTRWLKAEEVR